MKSDRVSGTSNQLPSTNEKMPAVYTTHKIVNRFLCLRTWVPECQVTNKVNKKRDKPKHRSQGKKIPKQMCTVVFFKESDTSLWRSRQN